MLRAKLYARTVDLEAPLWDALGEDPLSSHAVLAALEEARMPGVRMRFAILEQAGRPVAGVPLAILPVDAGRLTHGFFRRGIHAVRAMAPSFLFTSLALCGTPLSAAASPVRIRRPHEARPALQAAAGLLREFAEEEGAGFRAFKEFDETELAGARCLEREGWILLPSEPNLLLPLRLATFERYVAALRHPYRYKIAKSARRMERAGLTVDDVPLAEYEPGLHPLYENVLERAPVRLERLTPGFFTSLGRAFGPQARLIRFRREGRVTGWVALLTHGARAHDLFHGIDYEVNAAADLYFNQIAAAIRLAIDSGARSLVLGQSTETAKSRFGGEPRPLWIALRHRCDAANGLLRRFSEALFPEKRVPSRRVFHGARPTAAGVAP